MPIYNEIWAGPGRNVKRVDGQPQLTTKWYITIHNTSNDATARGEAGYATRRTDGVGAHYFIDNLEVLQSTDTDQCVGHVGSAQGNTRGISYEITGFNSWSRETWLVNVAWHQLAAVIARDCKQFGIPVRLLSIDQMRAFSSSLKGFVTHDMCRRAWGGTDHTDPGPGFPMDHLMALVSDQLNGEDMGWSEVTGDELNPGKVPAGRVLLGTNIAAFGAWNETKAIGAKVDVLADVIEKLADALNAGGGSIDTAAVLRGVDERLAAHRAAIEADTRDAVADLAEGGAAQVRAD